MATLSLNFLHLSKAVHCNYVKTGETSDLGRWRKRWASQQALVYNLGVLSTRRQISQKLHRLPDLDVKSKPTSITLCDLLGTYQVFRFSIVLPPTPSSSLHTNLQFTMDIHVVHIWPWSSAIKMDMCQKKRNIMLILRLSNLDNGFPPATPPRVSLWPVQVSKW